MKAIVEMELEVDGEYLESDETILIEQIMDAVYRSPAYEIDEDRCVIFVRMAEVTIHEGIQKGTITV